MGRPLPRRAQIWSQHSSYHPTFPQADIEKSRQLPRQSICIFKLSHSTNLRCRYLLPAYRIKMGNNRNRNNQNNGNRGGNGNGNGNNRNNNNNNNDGRPRCNHCNKLGHKANECYSNPNANNNSRPYCDHCKMNNHNTQNCKKKNGSDDSKSQGNQGKGKSQEQKPLSAPRGDLFTLHTDGPICHLCLQEENHTISWCLDRLWGAAGVAILAAWYRSGLPCGFCRQGHHDPTDCRHGSWDHPGLKNMIGAALWRQLADNQQRLTESSLHKSHPGMRDWSLSMDHWLKIPRQDSNGDMIMSDGWPIKYCMHCHLLDHWQGQQCPSWNPMDWAPGTWTSQTETVWRGTNITEGAWQGTFKGTGKSIGHFA